MISSNTGKQSNANVHGRNSAEAKQSWDHSSHERFYDYYAEESISEEALERFRRVRDHILRMIGGKTKAGKVLDVADLGCGAGTHSRVWAEAGHRVHALDVNGPLVELGRERTKKAGLQIDFRVGSATNLPWRDASMDVCVALELLEHVAEWEACVKEFMRVVRPGGAVFFTTTNQLCPVQAEFNLPLYSWYPQPVKRHFEKLSVTTRPDLANFARYPAVHWFTFYGMRTLLQSNGFQCFDRFDIMDLDEKTPAQRSIVFAVRAVPLLRWMGQVCTPGTVMLAIKNGRSYS